MKFALTALGLLTCALTSRVGVAQTDSGPDLDVDRKSEEVVVTGTHIRDVEPVTPVLVYTREDFDKAGAATAQEFMALLPQNFGGSQSGDTSGDQLDGLARDQGMGSSVNLRGVGSESTLVLVDGRRLAAAGRGDYSDISMIPLAAVERIEIVTDGASALYGSDAIGGVVNFILRKDFSGAETRLRYGDTTQGGASQQQLSQVFGVQWESGGVVAAYDYLDQSPLDRNDRKFSANAPGSRLGPMALMPGEERHGASLFAKQELSNRIVGSANIMYSRRDAETWDTQSGVVQPSDVAREQYGGGVGFDITLGGSWHALVNGTYDKGSLHRTTLQNPVTGGNFVWDSAYDLWSTDLLVSGDLVPLPWGAVKLAAGAGYREEALEYKTVRNGAVTAALQTEALQVQSAYAELSIPFGERGDRAHPPLTLSVAGRYEDYSTFGDTLDPTYGLRWAPLDAVSLYATYGTSFKAPNVYQFEQSPFFNTSVVFVNRLPGVARGLILSGNSDDLREQTAQTFTGGIELSLPVGDGLRARLNYFDIDYDNRIQSVDVNPVAVFSDPAYQSLVTLRGDMSDAEFNSLIAGDLSGADSRVVGCPVTLTAAGGCAAPPETFGAIVDIRLQNFSSVRVNGVDLALSQDLAWESNRLNLALDASYFFTFDQQLNPASPTRDILNMVYNPVDLRLRGSATWSRQQWSSTVSVNYITGYSTEGAFLRSDDSPMPAVDIASWTTLDWVLSYTLGTESGSSWLDGLAMSLNVLNALDKDPPYVDDQYYGLGYDPANADPRGRSISLMVNKRW